MTGRSRTIKRLLFWGVWPVISLVLIVPTWTSWQARPSHDWFTLSAQLSSHPETIRVTASHRLWLEGESYWLDIKISGLSADHLVDGESLTLTYYSEDGSGVGTWECGPNFRRADGTGGGGNVRPLDQIAQTDELSTLETITLTPRDVTTSSSEGLTGILCIKPLPAGFADQVHPTFVSPGLTVDIGQSYLSFESEFEFPSGWSVWAMHGYPEEEPFVVDWKRVRFQAEIAEQETDGHSFFSQVITMNNPYAAEQNSLRFQIGVLFAGAWFGLLGGYLFADTWGDKGPKAGPITSVRRSRPPATATGVIGRRLKRRR